MKERTGETGAADKSVGRLLLFAGIMILIDALFLGLSMWRYELWWNETAAAAVMLVLLGALYAAKLGKELEKRFFWLLGLHFFELAVIFVSYQAEGMLRPVLAVPILVSLMAGSGAGVYAMIFYSVASALVCADPTEIVLLYLSAGLFGIHLFAGREKVREFLIGGAGFLLCYIAGNIVISLYAYAQLQTVDVLYSVLGGILQLLPVFCFLPFLAGGGIHLPGVTGLAAIVSPDFPALAEFSEREPVCYKHSCLVAKLSARAAAVVGANALLAEAGGLYHEIGMGLGEDDIQESLRICKQYRLPASVQNIIKEHDPDKKTPSGKESALVMISDTIVNLMEQNRKRNLSDSPDTEGAVARAFRVREDSGAFLLSGLTEKELEDLLEFYMGILG